ncbi:MAG: 16S rRNA (guanine(527)-N(7))-methyltransferase RsmG, partial [Campylobacter sp.]|nr:16S rRNA (guanine(527)-N(7))-methyltransferase RsmG [Campylobacter sp.]
MKFDKSFNDKFGDKITKYKEILTKFNSIHDLTNYEDIMPAIKDSFDGAEFIDSYPKVAIDIGSGAGFPGLFLAMEFNECEWHLFEPNFKSSSFLSYIKLDLKLKNVTIHHEKIENASKFRADLITSRAVMKTDKLLEISKDFYDEDTEFLLYKGSSVENELAGLNAKIHTRNNRRYVHLKGI